MADPQIELDAHPRRAKVRLRLSMPAAKEAARHGLPGMLEARTTSDVTALTLGPDQWLLLSDQHSADKLIEMCASEFASVRYHAVDFSAALSCASIQGEKASVLLSMGAGIDWSSPCVRTRFAAIPVVAHRRADHSFELYYDRSLREYLSKWVSHALRDPLFS